MKTFLYVIAWAPPSANPANRALIFRHHLLVAEAVDSAYALGQEWAQQQGITPLPGPGNDYVVELNPNDASDLQLAHDIANMREMVRTGGSVKTIADAEESLKRMERLAVNCLLNAFGLPLMPVPTSHPLPVFDGPQKSFVPGGEYHGEGKS